jgi:hypothetical protein
MPIFSLHHVQTSSQAHPALYEMGIGGSSPEEKQPRHEADHSPPSSAEVKNAWSYTSTPSILFMAWYLMKQSIYLRGMVLY